jgi:hypothetical protein
MAGLQTEDTEQNRSALLWGQFMDWLCGNKGHNKESRQLSQCRD